MDNDTRLAVEDYLSAAAYYADKAANLTKRAANACAIRLETRHLAEAMEVRVIDLRSDAEKSRKDAARFKTDTPLDL